MPSSILETVTNEDHNKYISWAFLAHATFQLLITFVMMLFMSSILWLPSRPGDGAPPPGFMVFIMGFVLVFQLFFVVPSFVAAYAMRNKRSWARIAAIIAGVVAAMNVPFGTAACVYSLWFFLGESWKDVYARSDKDYPSERHQLVADMQTHWSGMRTDEKGEVTFHHVEPPDWR